jgi:ribose transport system substrate-binding protein
MQTLTGKFGLQRLIAIMMLIAIIFASVSASQAADTPEWLSGAKLKKPLSETRIGITVLYPGSNSYQAKYAETATEYSKELGIQATVLDPQGDPAVQFNQIQDLIAQKMDVIVVWPTSQNALIPAIRQASRAGIPVITSNSPIATAGQRYIVAHTGPDDCRQAQFAAEQLGEALEGKGNIVVIEGTPGYSVAIIRKNCFLDTMEDKFPDIKILDSQPANWNREKAQTIMEGYLTKYKGKIDGIYAFDDGMGLGAINALKAAGYKPGEIKITTCNLFREGYVLIKEGWHTGSNQQSPIDDAKLAIQTAIKVANGIEVPRLQTIETPKINKNNVDQFEQPTW